MEAAEAIIPEPSENEASVAEKYCEDDGWRVKD
jgi:hypothetical protein